MLQNRVDPFGEIIKTSARGAWLGNRGALHDSRQEIVRTYKLKAWITCVLEFRGRHREVMQPGRWTELFFFDEATAFSAGHRPCFQCRYKDHRRFKEYWLVGNPEYRFSMKTPVAAIDDILHAERMAADKSKITYEENVQTLPDGVFVVYDGEPYLLAKGKLHLWTPGGYTKTIALPTGRLPVLMPRSVVNMFRAGYTVQIGM